MVRSSDISLTRGPSAVGCLSLMRSLRGHRSKEVDVRCLPTLENTGTAGRGLGCEGVGLGVGPGAGESVC